ncbi:unnamed protein product [Bursaphelenchus xylophilus]|uniref:(pine wood nematode) hypothetical protein n=1 Tax=Bursaphelenchus xylophilus TaxID=6326 RepID=A0A1I7S5A4_BURXY|nr:unnamed protein product [Bursaphelenchus xylophilus]CAG9117867.1 unnamed protein product [Bursaphelenchus xylophilus]
MSLFRSSLFLLASASVVCAQYPWEREFWSKNKTETSTVISSTRADDQYEDFDLSQFEDITDFGEDLATKRPDLMKEINEFIGDNGTRFCDPCVTAADYLRSNSYEVTASVGTIIITRVCPSLVSFSAGQMFCAFASGTAGHKFGQAVAAAVAKWEPEDVCKTLKMC